MTAPIPYVFLRARPDLVRGEELNLGLVAFSAAGPRVYVNPPRERVAWFNPDLATMSWPEWSADLEVFLSRLGDASACHQWLRTCLDFVRADDDVGELFPSAEESEEQLIQEILQRFVDVPQRRLARRSRAQPSRSRLHLDLRRWFRSAGLFSTRLSDLSTGKIVPSFPISVQDDLYADFAMANGTVHIIEAFDVRGFASIGRSARGEIGFKSVLLDQARRHGDGLRTLAVTAADDYAMFRPMLNLVRKYADDVFAVESGSDRQRLADLIAQTLHSAPPLDAGSSLTTGAALKAAKAHEHSPASSRVDIQGLDYQFDTTDFAGPLPPRLGRN